jgi:hypothetical protein
VTLRVRIYRNILVNLGWYTCYVEVRSGVVANLLVHVRHYIGV